MYACMYVYETMRTLGRENEKDAEAVSIYMYTHVYMHTHIYMYTYIGSKKALGAAATSKKPSVLALPLVCLSLSPSLQMVKKRTRKRIVRRTSALEIRGRRC